MTYLGLAYVHLATVVPALLIGAWLMLNHKGTPTHRMLGRTYMVLMAATGGITLLMPAFVGPRLLGHFGFIHLFSALALYTVPTAWQAARRGDVVAHRAAMIGLYCGGLIAGAVAVAPGRQLNDWLFG